MDITLKRGRYFSRRAFTFFQTRIQSHWGPLDGAGCDNSCGRVLEFISESKDNTNDNRSCCGKNKSITVKLLI